MTRDDLTPALVAKLRRLRGVDQHHDARYVGPPDLQRMLGIGYTRARRLHGELVEVGVLSAPDSLGRSEVLP